MKHVLLAGCAALISTSAFAQSAGAFLGQELRDRGSAVIATERAHENFAVARERAMDGNYVGAEIARERGLAERDRADHDVMAAERNRAIYHLTR